jgi:hypothetical protein
MRNSEAQSAQGKCCSTHRYAEHLDFQCASERSHVPVARRLWWYSPYRHTVAYDLAQNIAVQVKEVFSILTNCLGGLNHLKV